MRVKYRWEVIKQENEAIKTAKQLGKRHIEESLSNGDTLKQLLAGSRYLLFKSREKWTDSQCSRSKILFDLYPKIKKVYKLSNELRVIYNSSIEKI